jgi:hypothetical protein
MGRLALLSVLGLFVTPAGASAPSGAQHALYLAQRFAHSGDLPRAVAAAKSAVGAVPSCSVVVKLRARGATIPLCATSAIRLPAAEANRIQWLLRRAAAADSAAAARLFEEAWRLDPFDPRLAPRLVRALRSVGKENEARRVEAEAAQLAHQKPLVWAGSNR